MPLLGYRYQAVMLMPAALSLLALVLWLIAKGFEERRLKLDELTEEANEAVR
jgi:hypothetical protein